ncbi:MAG: Peptidase [Ilumatobacteraceae bacterium]|nr:Peptidase [Ilumatobacteraceae bacterium]
MSEVDPPSGPRPTPRADGDGRASAAPDPAIWTEEPPPPARPARAPARRAPRPSSSRTIIRGAVVFLAGVLVGAVLIAVTSRDEGSTDLDAGKAPAGATTTAARAEEDPPKGTGSAPTTTAPPTAETTAAPTEPTPVTTPPAGSPNALAIASALSPLPLPSDCPLPLGDSESLPNAARDYRGGVHEGIDFICGEYGHDAVATMDGQVLVANGSFKDPTPEERLEILNTAKQIGHTPPWTLAMLFGRFVAIDHGIKPGVGHVVTIYAHLNEIDPAIVPGHHVKAGDRIGEIGNAGTESAGTGEARPQAIHLHWEIHVDDAFLAQGATGGQTSDVYAELFGR